MKHVHCIVNLQSGDFFRQDPIKKSNRFIERVRHFFPNCSFSFLDKKHQDARILVQQAFSVVDEHLYPQLLIVAGGDGSIGQVVNGLLQVCTEINIPIPKLGIINIGSGGDFARTVFLPHDIEQNLCTIRDGRNFAIDIGEISYVDFSDQKKVHYFINETSIGLSAQIAESTNHVQEKGNFSYIWHSFLKNLTATNHALTITWSNHKGQTQRWQTKSGLLAVCNGKYFGNAMQIAPYARLDDGLLDMTVFSYWHRLQAPLHLKRLYDGTILRSNRVRFERLSSVTIKANSSSSMILVECDGEVIGKLPVKIKVLPKALCMRI